MCQALLQMLQIQWWTTQTNLSPSQGLILFFFFFPQGLILYTGYTGELSFHK